MHHRQQQRGTTAPMQKVLFDSYIDQGKLKHPGIARYNLETETNVRADRAPAYSMRERTRVHDKTRTIEPQNANPGPERYENNPEMSKTLYSSHFSRIGYSNSKSRRFLNPGTSFPTQTTACPGQPTTTTPQVCPKWANTSSPAIEAAPMPSSTPLPVTPSSTKSQRWPSQSQVLANTRRLPNSEYMMEMCMVFPG